MNQNPIKTVLLVEDNPGDARLLREMFNEVLIMFIAGENPTNLPPFQEIAQLCEDLTKEK